MAYLPDDVKVAIRLYDDIVAGRNVVSVGESGTLYRSIVYWSMVKNWRMEIFTTGTLAPREITIPENLLELTPQQLSKLDNQTSQWLSAAMISGYPFTMRDLEEVYSPFLLLTWEAKRKYEKVLYEDPSNFHSVLGYDNTLFRQFVAYRKWLQTSKLDFLVSSSEDVCFAVAMGYDIEELLPRFPQIVTHESNRYEAMVELTNAGPMPSSLRNSRDHRVVMATAMKFGLGPGFFAHPQCVSKSCPRFWDFMYMMKKIS
jgi:hypothetical protein